MGVDPVSIGAEAAAVPAIEGASKGAEAAGALAPAAAGAEAAVPAGALALPEISVTAPTLAEAGAAGAAGTGATLGGAETAAALGAGGLGLISPAEAGGLSPSSVVAGEFGQLPSTAATGTQPYKLGGTTLVGGPVPLPTPAPGLGGGSPLSPGTAPANTIQPDAGVIDSGGGPGSGSALNQYEGNVLSEANPPGASAITQPSGGGITDFLGKNKNLLTLLGLGVGGQLASGPISNALGLNKVPGSQDLKALAQQEATLASGQQAYGQQLQQPLLTGVLPPGQQQAVTNALNDAIATIKGRYGSLGLSGSSMEAEAIANAKNRSVEAAGQIEQQMAQTGTQAISSATANLGLEEQIYNTLLNATIQQDQALGNSISRFASAVGLGTALKGGVG